MATSSTPLGIMSLSYNTDPTSKPITTNHQKVTASNDLTHLLHSLLDQCSNLKQLKQIHAHMLRTGTFFEPYSASKLTAAALSPFSSLEYARKVFDEIPRPNLYTWNTLMRAYSMSPKPEESFRVFLRMLDECSEGPNKFTYPFVIKAASQLSDLRLGKAFHGMAVKANLGLDLYIMNALVYMYGSGGELDMARQVFVRILVKDVVSWNSMISAYVQGECVDEALYLFKEMEAENVKPNHITMIGVLSACTKKMDLELGKSFCSYIERNGILMTLPLNNAVLDMYMKCKSVEDAKSLYDEMVEKDIVTWTIMLDGYAKLENYEEAQRILDSMPVQDIAVWNALISAYEQNGKPKEAVELFHELQVRKSIKPDQVTLVSTLSACAQLGAMDLGGWIHVYIRKLGMDLNCHLVTSLIDMYSKCGDLEKAFEVFNSAEKKDVYVWGAMIAGLAMHGRGKDAINLFSKMQEDNVRPSAVTYTNLLCACSHSGLLEEGRYLFDQMETVHGIVPGVKHYSCMVDILGRAGRLKDAVEFIEKMPIAPSTSVWGALLSACRIHGDVSIAEKAFSHLLELDPVNHGAIVLLSNVYAKAGNWDAVSQLRKQMREHGIKKEPGCSSIEYNGKVHNFLVGDNSHPLAEKIYLKLDEISARLKSIGYVPDESDLLQLVEENEMKEQALNLHSEKLAIAFGLLTHGQSAPIRIVKNLRVCKDCHSVAKLISKLYNREILLRDRYRFHHFKGGNCSCCDYW